LQASPRGQLKVMLYEDLVSNPRDFLRRIFEFIGVDTEFAIDTSLRHNTGLVKRSTRTARFLNTDFPGRKLVTRNLPESLRKIIGRKIERKTHEAPIPVSPDIRNMLVQVFSEDVLALQSVLRQDLSAWLL